MDHERPLDVMWLKLILRSNITAGYLVIMNLPPGIFLLAETLPYAAVYADGF